MLKCCNCELEKIPFDVVAEGQMKTHPLKHWYHIFLMSDLKTKNHDIQYVFTRYAKLRRLERRLSNPLKSVVNLIKRLF